MGLYFLYKVEICDCSLSISAFWPYTQRCFFRHQVSHTFVFNLKFSQVSLKSSPVCQVLSAHEVLFLIIFWLLLSCWFSLFLASLTTVGCRPLFGLKLRNFPLSSGITIPPCSGALVSIHPCRNSCSSDPASSRGVEVNAACSLLATSHGRPLEPRRSIQAQAGRKGSSQLGQVGRHRTKAGRWSMVRPQ